MASNLVQHTPHSPRLRNRCLGKFSAHPLCGQHCMHLWSILTSTATESPGTKGVIKLVTACRKIGIKSVPCSSCMQDDVCCICICGTSASLCPCTWDTLKDCPRFFCVEGSPNTHLNKTLTLCPHAFGKITPGRQEGALA